MILREYLVVLEVQDFRVGLEDLRDLECLVNLQYPKIIEIHFEKFSKKYLFRLSIYEYNQYFRISNDCLHVGLKVLEGLEIQVFLNGHLYLDDLPLLVSLEVQSVQEILALRQNPLHQFHQQHQVHLEGPYIVSEFKY